MAIQTIESLTAQPMFLGEVFIEVRSVYGQMKAYPMCERSRTFAEIAGTKTLTRHVLIRIERMGFEIVSQANANWHQVEG